jgi:hypothetical protein
VVEHNPDLNPSLDEIESAAAVVASFWLDQADRAAIDAYFDPKQRQHAVAGCTIAAAIQYQAERHVDAAERIAEGLRAVASAIRESRQATEGGAP